MDMVRPAHWLCNGHQEILGVLIHWREGFQKDVSIWSLEENRIKGNEKNIQEDRPCNIVYIQEVICKLYEVRKSTIQTCLTTQRGREV